VNERGATALRLGQRVAELEALFERVAATRMRGVPILHPGLAVKAVGFEATADGDAAVGVLVTPWFMNLFWLPLAEPPPDRATPAGTTRTRLIGREHFDFIGAHEAGFGAYETCSLFSPMADFVDQAAAVATAEQVLILLRTPEAEAAPDAAAPPAGSATSRRALLFGRGAAAAEGSR
jgi:[NiFe] hydrogenase assembly HybE family chaperone